MGAQDESTHPGEVRPPRFFRGVEVGSIVLCLGATTSVARDVLLGALVERPPVLVMGLAVVLGYLLTDLVSGVVHFVGDSFGTVETPWLGRTFVLPFRSHHVDPGDICVHDFVETNGNNAFASLFLVVPVAWSHLPARGGLAAAFGVFVVVFTVSVLLTNQIHKWAHVARPPRIVRALQRAGLLLSPEAHTSHHSPPHRGGYCVTSGVWNRILDPIDFFPKLERGIRRLLRLERGTA